jgi:hypothetical protein
MPGLLRFVVAFSEAPDAGEVGIQMMWDVRAPAIQMSDNLFEALQQVVDGVGLTRTSEGNVHVELDGLRAVACALMDLLSRSSLCVGAASSCDHGDVTWMGEEVIRHVDCTRISSSSRATQCRKCHGHRENVDCRRRLVGRKKLSPSLARLLSQQRRQISPPNYSVCLR